MRGVRYPRGRCSLCVQPSISLRYFLHAYYVLEGWRRASKAVCSSGVHMTSCGETEPSDHLLFPDACCTESSVLPGGPVLGQVPITLCDGSLAMSASSALQKTCTTEITEDL